MRRCLIDAGMVVEAVALLCIVTGTFDRVAALMLAGFCTVTAVGYHQFWTHGDLGAGASRQLTRPRTLSGWRTSW